MEKYSGLKPITKDLLDELAKILAAKKVKALIVDPDMLMVNRDDMVQIFKSDKIPEEKGGAYDLALKSLQVKFPNLYMNWSSKTDDDLYLEVFER